MASKELHARKEIGPSNPARFGLTDKSSSARVTIRQREKQNGRGKNGDSSSESREREWEWSLAGNHVDGG